MSSESVIKWSFLLVVFLIGQTVYCQKSFSIDGCDYYLHPIWASEASNPYADLPCSIVAIENMVYLAENVDLDFHKIRRIESLGGGELEPIEISIENGSDYPGEAIIKKLYGLHLASDASGHLIALFEPIIPKSGSMTEIADIYWGVVDKANGKIHKLNCNQMICPSYGSCYWGYVGQVRVTGDVESDDWQLCFTMSYYQTYNDYRLMQCQIVAGSTGVNCQMLSAQSGSPSTLRVGKRTGMDMVNDRYYLLADPDHDIALRHVDYPDEHIAQSQGTKGGNGVHSFSYDGRQFAVYGDLEKGVNNIAIFNEDLSEGINPLKIDVSFRSFKWLTYFGDTTIRMKSRAGTTGGDWHLTTSAYYPSTNVMQLYTYTPGHSVQGFQLSTNNRVTAIDTTIDSATPGWKYESRLLTFDAKVRKATVFTVSGGLIAEWTDVASIPFDNFASGVYIVKTEYGVIKISVR